MLKFILCCMKIILSPSIWQPTALLCHCSRRRKLSFLHCSSPLPACLYWHEGIDLKELELITKGLVFTFSYLPLILSVVLYNPLTLSVTHFLYLLSLTYNVLMWTKRSDRFKSSLKEIHTISIHLFFIFSTCFYSSVFYFSGFALTLGKLQLQIFKY